MHSDSESTYVIGRMDSRDTDLIAKIHSMQWLKSNTQVSGHVKTLPHGRETKSQSDEQEVNKKKDSEKDTSMRRDSSIENSIDRTSDVNADEGDSVLRRNLESTLAIVELSKKNMETVWDKDINVAETLFSNSQSLTIQRLNEEEMMSMALAESIVTAQIEQFRFNDDEKGKSEESLDVSGEDSWNRVCRNLPDPPKLDKDVDNQVSSKQCHDNNNNNAKSKSQSASEVKKGVNKVNPKISAKKPVDQKNKKPTGSTSKLGLKDDSLNVSDGDTKTSPETDLKKSSVASKINEKSARTEGYNNRYPFIGKGARMREQTFTKPHLPTFNDSSKNRFPAGGSEDKSKFATAKLPPPRVEPNKKFNESDDAKKCHRVQVARTQSYNPQYVRNTSLVKSQQRYPKAVSKSEYASFNADVSTPTESELKKKSLGEQAIAEKQGNDVQSGEKIVVKTCLSSDAADCAGIEYNSIKSGNSVVDKNASQIPFTKTSIEKNTKDETAYTQKFKKDSNVFRRSSDYTEPKNINVKTKTDDQKEHVDNKLTMDYKVSRVSTADVKLRTQPDSRRTTVNPAKTVTGANKINKTDTSGSSSLTTVQSGKSFNSTISTNQSAHTRQEPRNLQAPFTGTEVQSIAKTEQGEHSNKTNNNKATGASSTELKSVKFADNIEINTAAHSAVPYSSNPLQQPKQPTNSFYSELQNASYTSSVPRADGHYNLPNKSYFDNAAQYSDNCSANVQNSDRNLHLLDVLQRKTTEQTLQVSSQTIAHAAPNPPISTGNGLHYQNIPPIYVNQYNGGQNVIRKAADATNVSQNVPIPSTSSYNIENPNLLQPQSSNILMHNTQTPIIPPPGFHNHPIATQHNQWNLPLPDFLYFGNMMNPAHPLNLQIQNSRQLCSTDYNNIQQTGYLQHPMFYMPQFCVQGWNPLLQYPAPVFQNPQYANCTFPNQVMPANNLVDSINCSVPTSSQNNLFKHFQQMQQLENASYSAPVKPENYMHGGKSNVRMKDNPMDSQMRTSHYHRTPVPNEYQTCSQDAQMMTPYSYPPMDSVPRSVQSNVYTQMNPKYQTGRPVNNANYQRMTETPSIYQSSQDSTRREEIAKNDLESIPPMVSPRDCLYYGVNHNRKADMQHSSSRTEMKPSGYMHSGSSSQHCGPQYNRNATFNAPPREYGSKMPLGRGIRKVEP